MSQWWGHHHQGLQDGRVLARRCQSGNLRYVTYPWIYYDQTRSKYIDIKLMLLKHFGTCSKINSLKIQNWLRYGHFKCITVCWSINILYLIYRISIYNTRSMPVMPMGTSISARYAAWTMVAVHCLQSIVCIPIFAVQCLQTNACSQMLAVWCLQANACSPMLAVQCLQSNACNPMSLSPIKIQFIW